MRSAGRHGVSAQGLWRLPQQELGGCQAATKEHAALTFDSMFRPVARAAMFGDESVVTWDSPASGSGGNVVPGKLRVREVRRLEVRAALRAWEVLAATEEPAVLIFGDWGSG